MRRENGISTQGARREGDEQVSAKRKYDFRGIPTRVLLKEIGRRGSLAYARNVNREFRLRREQAAKEKETSK